jgi:hypothetical protein
LALGNTARAEGHPHAKLGASVAGGLGLEDGTGVGAGTRCGVDVAVGVGAASVSNHAVLVVARLLAVGATPAAATVGNTGVCIKSRAVTQTDLTGGIPAAQRVPITRSLLGVLNTAAALTSLSGPHAHRVGGADGVVAGGVARGSTDTADGIEGAGWIGVAGGDV